MPKVGRSVRPMRTAQLRVLLALARSGRRLMTRPELAEAAGFTPVSGTANTALRGIRPGSSSGKAHPGLIALGFVARREIDLDGEEVVAYEITEEGEEALEREMRAREGRLPDLKDKESCSNGRYAGRHDRPAAGRS